jgi:hypothetical protein
MYNKQLHQTGTIYNTDSFRYAQIRERGLIEGWQAELNQDPTWIKYQN